MKKIKLYTKTCKRCGKFYKSPARMSKICPKCSKSINYKYSRYCLRCGKFFRTNSPYTKLCLDCKDPNRKKRESPKNLAYQFLKENGIESHFKPEQIKN